MFCLSVSHHHMYTQAYSMLDQQFAEQRINYILDPHFNSLVNIITILIVLPIVNHAVLPFLSLRMSLKIRISIGLVLNLLAIAAATFLQGTVESNAPYHTGIRYQKLLWLFLPSILLALGEMITFITGKSIME